MSVQLGSISPPKGVYQNNSELKNHIGGNNLGSEDDEDVDVEQFSDNENDIKNNSSKRPLDEQNANKTPPPPTKKKKEDKPKFMKPKCNCEELLHVDCYLETKELWDKFNELGTEMIITKTGR